MSSFKINESEVDALNDFLKDLMKEIDVLSARIESATPPRSINSSSQELDNQEILDHVRSVEYTVVKGDEVDITNVQAYEEAKINESRKTGTDCFSKLSLLETGDVFNSISSSFSLFSPKEPISNDNIVECFDSPTTPDESLRTISSADTICKPGHNEQLPFCVPYDKFEGSPFHLFSTTELDRSTTNYVDLRNRSVAYYGKVPYTYGSIHHKPRDFNENAYLMKILSYIEIVIPGIRYNSAMVHRYLDGEAFIPHHSDDESCIDHVSDIITISLGDTRDLEFSNKSDKTITHVTLNHGDVLTMSRNSQNFYSHSIPIMPCKSLRLSITLRQIHELNVQPVSLSVSPSVSENSVSTVTAFLNDLTDRNPGENVYNENEVPTASVLTSPLNQGTQTLPWTFNEAQTGMQQFQPYVFPALPPPPLNSQFSWQRPGWQPPYTPLASEPPPRINSHQHYNSGDNLSHIHNTRSGWQPPEQNERPPPTMTHNLPDVQFPASQIHPTRQNIRPNPSQNQAKPASDVVFISSSMFADLDPVKLSSREITAHLFYYPGADAFRMKNKLLGDERFQQLSRRGNVTKIFLLTGTNNVDAICQKRQSLQEGCTHITNIINYIHSVFCNAQINVLSILPRVRNDRIKVIEKLNEHIQVFCTRNSSKSFCFIDTYGNRMFVTRDGVRRTELFKSTYQNDFDNVHMNSYGVIKVGRHLKYLAHQE